MELSAAGVRPARRRRRALALALVALALAATVAAFALGGTGSTGAKIEAVAGSTSAGVAEIVPLNSKVTRSNGGAQLQAGVALDRIAVAESEANNIQVLVAWTNVKEAANVLRNPNAQISVGLYHPIHTGACTSSNEKLGKEDNVVAPEVTITDEWEAKKQTLCGKLDEGAKGSASVSEKGKLLLGTKLISGFIDPQEAGPGSLAECEATGTKWCEPESVPASAHQLALYLVASIVTPGGIPQGQQPEGTSLEFFARARRR